MTLLEDARRLLQPGQREEPNDGAIPYPSYLYCRGEMARGQHAEDCPWPRRAQILAALEAAERATTIEYGPVNSHSRCHWCDEFSTTEGHQPDCPWQALVTALRGEVALPSGSNREVLTGPLD